MATGKEGLHDAIVENTQHVVEQDPQTGAIQAELLIAPAHAGDMLTIVQAPDPQLLCSIYNHGGVYRCHTHKRIWGALIDPDEPCEGWTA